MLRVIFLPSWNSQRGWVQIPTCQFLLFIIGKLPSGKMNFPEPNTFIYIPFPKQAQFRFNYKFHKMIHVISIFNSQKLSYFEIIRFLINLGFIFYCEKTATKSITQFTFNISCPECKKKLFKIILHTSRECVHIFTSLLCDHITAFLKKIEDNRKDYLFQFL